jgi:hypothetical protein
MLAFFFSHAQDKKDNSSASVKQKTTSTKSKLKMKKRILIIVSNAHMIGPNNRRTGIFLPEVAHPYAEFTKADY